MSQPKLGQIIEMLEKGENFELTNQQYKKKTGLNIPVDKSYTEKRSAVARKAAEYGCSIEKEPEKMKFRKIR